MSTLSKMKRGLFHKEHTTTGYKLFQAAEYGAASYGFGWFMSKYRESYAKVAGVHTDLLVGGVMKAIGIFTGNSHANVIGNAGIGAFFHTWGAGHGAVAAVPTARLVRPGQVPHTLAGYPNATVLGAIGRAPIGDFLTPRELANLASG